MNLKFKHFFICITLILIIWAFFIEPYMLKVNHLTLESKELNDFKIVFVGDFHVKTYQKKRLIQVVNKINELQPDLVLAAGDFVNGHDKKNSLPIECIASELSKLNAKYGFYTVLGNHDHRYGIYEIKKVFEKNGIIILNNDSKLIKIGKTNLYIAGIDDITEGNPDIVKALKNAHSPCILLTHSPDIFPFITKEENLPYTSRAKITLAGHTHGGQVCLPFVGAIIIPSDYGNKYAKGLIEENGQKLFVTKGIGTSILPIRFNCAPEIVLVTLK